MRTYVRIPLSRAETDTRASAHARTTHVCTHALRVHARMHARARTRTRIRTRERNPLTHAPHPSPLPPTHTHTHTHTHTRMRGRDNGLDAGDAAALAETLRALTLLTSLDLRSLAQRPVAHGPAPT